MEQYIDPMNIPESNPQDDKDRYEFLKKQILNELPDKLKGSFVALTTIADRNTSFSIDEEKNNTNRYR